MDNIDRRGFLGTAVAAAAISQPLLSSSVLGSTRSLGSFVRRAVSGLAANDPYITGYATAVAAMKALPSSDPCSWAVQAAIHGPGHPPAGPCNHATLFWAWHRMYLYWFERIVRSKSGVAYWALPYWDYDWQATPSSAVLRQIPVPLRDTTSTLYDSTRNTALNNGSGSLSLGATGISASFAPSLYTSAQPAVVGTPHNVVHATVGGNMGAFNTAGLDPLFWMHHSEIDRLWNLWLAQGGRTDPLSDPSWTGASFTFYDENGNQVNMTPCQVLNAGQQLNYVYEFEPTQVLQSCPGRHIGWIKYLFATFLNQAYILNSNQQTLPIGLSKDQAARLAKISNGQGNTINLQFAGVEADADPGASWEVYVGQHGEYKLTPDSPSYVGSLALFGDGIKGQSDMPAEFTFPLTYALVKGFDPTQLEITLVASSGVEVDGRPVPPEIQSPVTINQMNLLVDTHNAVSRVGK